MNDNIGSILLKTRQERNLSLEQVAEETYIKIEYLESMESGKFDAKIPDVFKRGFLRLYADYLKLDGNELLQHCPVKKFETLTSTQKRRNMTLNIIKKSKAEEKSHVDPNITVKVDDVFDEEESVSHDNKFSFAKLKDNLSLALGIKYGLIALVCFVVFLFGYKLFSKKPTALSSDADSNPTHDTSTALANNKKHFTIQTSNEVKIMIRAKDTKEKIFSGIVSKGAQQTIEYQSPVQIFFDHGEFFTIETSTGEIIHPDHGRGGMELL